MQPSICRTFGLQMKQPEFLEARIKWWRNAGIGRSAEASRPGSHPPAVCAIAYIARDKIATAIAVVLLISPDFITPFSTKSLPPTGWVTNA